MDGYLQRYLIGNQPRVPITGMVIGTSQASEVPLGKESVDLVHVSGTV